MPRSVHIEMLFFFFSGKADNLTCRILLQFSLWCVWWFSGKDFTLESFYRRNFAGKLFLGKVYFTVFGIHISFL